MRGGVKLFLNSIFMFFVYKYNVMVLCGWFLIPDHLFLKYHLHSGEYKGYFPLDPTCIEEAVILERK